MGGDIWLRHHHLPGEVGSRFRGHNRKGLARWSTPAKIVVATRSVQMLLPVSGHTPFWSRCGLVEGMLFGAGQRGSVGEL